MNAQANIDLHRLHVSFSFQLFARYVTLFVHLCIYLDFFTTCLHAALPFSAPAFLKTYENEFFDIINPKHGLRRLKRKGVISADVVRDIDDENDEEAKEILFEHLQNNATLDTLKEYCEVVIAADGFPRMQELGRKMMGSLQKEGWCRCMYLCMFVYV